MNFRDEVTIVRPSGSDFYGNPAASWDTPETVAVVKGFVSSSGTAYFPAGTDLQATYRACWAGRTYAIDDPKVARSPSRDVLATCTLRRVEGMSVCLAG